MTVYVLTQSYYNVRKQRRYNRSFIFSKNEQQVHDIARALKIDITKCRSDADIAFDVMYYPVPSAVAEEAIKRGALRLTNRDMQIAAFRFFTSSDVDL